MRILTKLLPLIFVVNVLVVVVAFGIFPEKLKKILKIKKTKKPKSCSIHDSAVVRKVLQEEFFPVYAKYGIKVPKRCRLNKERDIYGWIEGNKTEEGISSKCEFCGKSFYEQYDLYEHAKRKHSNWFLDTKNSVCLADYCDIFRCELHKKYPHNIPQNITCHKKNVNDLRRKCEALARSCLPDNMQHVIYDKLYIAICSTLTCEKFLQPFKDSVSVLTVVTLSIALPISLFIVANICITCWDNMEDEDADEKFRLSKRAEYNARNAPYDNRYYAVRERGYNIRHRNKHHHHHRVNRIPR